MKIKWGALVVDGRNKIGGHVASKNRSGAYLRTKVTPSNPQTIRQLEVRQNFTSNAQAWRGLTQAQRDAWISSVSNFISTDVFGDTITPSGFNLFISLNNNLLNVGEAAIDTPPLPESVLGFTALALDADTSGNKIIATFAPAIDADTKVILWATAALSPGKKFVKAEYRQVAVLDNTDVTPHEFQVEYIAKFGALPAIGTKVFCKFLPINTTTGQAGAMLDAFDIAA